jgi:hypothetical protein
MSAPLVRLFTRVNCCLCEPVKFILQKSQQRYGFRLEYVDLARPENKHFLAAYSDHIPVVDLDGREIARHKLEERELVKHLEQAGLKLNEER